MASFNLSLAELYTSYKDWVSKNPETASDFESAFKWISYFVAGRINKSSVLTECVYSVSNLLVLFNDQIIHASKQKLGTAGEKIKVWLTVLEYSEVFIEISAKNLWGQKGKWMIIICVQLLKCAARLGLLLHYKQKIVSCPPFSPLKRSQVTVQEGRNPDGSSTVNNVAFSLKRSGRVIRKVEAAPSFGNRLWKPPLENPDQNDGDVAPDRVEMKQLLTGEILYIVKPVAHLAATWRYGSRSWRPWMLSLALDLTSLFLLHKNPGGRQRKLSKEQRVELSRRQLLLILYIMRSPFYDRYSKTRVNAFLDGLSSAVPLARLICNPVKQYIPYWQDTYFYMWSS